MFCTLTYLPHFRSILAKDHGDTSKEELQAQGAANYTALLLPVGSQPLKPIPTWSFGTL